MGGDDSQKLLPWRGTYSSPGRKNLRLMPNQHCNGKLKLESRGQPPPSVAGPAVASATGRLGHSWKAQPGQFWKAPKDQRDLLYSDSG